MDERMCFWGTDRLAKIGTRRQRSSAFHWWRRPQLPRKTQIVRELGSVDSGETGEGGPGQTTAAGEQQVADGKKKAGGRWGQGRAGARADWLDGGGTSTAVTLWTGGGGAQRRGANAVRD